MPSVVHGTTLHNLAWAFLDALIVVSTAWAIYKIGFYFYLRFLCRQSQPKHDAVAIIFSITFTLSFALYQLLICEITGILQSSSRKVLWHVILFLLIAFLIFVLPFSQVYYLCTNLGYSKSKALRISILCQIVFLYGFWKFGDIFVGLQKSGASVRDLILSDTISDSNAGVAENWLDAKLYMIKNKWSSVFMVDRIVDRILVIGTTMLAVISGVSAVNLPFEILTVHVKKVTEQEIENLEMSLKNIYQDIRMTKLTRIIRQTEQRHNAKMDSSFRSTHAPQTIPPAYYDDHDAIIKNQTFLPPRTSQVFSGLENDTFRLRHANQVKHNDGSDVLLDMTVSFNDVPHQTDEEYYTRLEALQKYASELFSTYDFKYQSWKRLEFAQTKLGRLYELFGYFLLLFCIARVGAAVFNITIRKQAIGQINDPALQVRHFFSLFGVEIDLVSWSQYMTFTFTILIIIINVRGSLLRILQTFHLISPDSAYSSTVAVFLAQLMGANFLSSIVLIRSRLPPAYRRLMSSALGGVEFNFYRKWFDILFIASVTGMAIVNMRAVIKPKKHTRLIKYNRK